MQKKLGEDAQVADWVYNLEAMNEDEVTELMVELGIPVSYNEESYFVTNEGQKYWGNSERVYNFENHAGMPPSNWLVHDQYAGLTLGSWYGLEGKILCVR